MFASFSDTLHYLYTRLPMFDRIGKRAYKEDLTNIRALCNALQNPQEKFPSIHVAGTNGKGSTSHMLASIFQQAGYKTGLYTSPHLKKFTERIRINGAEIDEAYVTDFVNQWKDKIEEIEPSFFEITVALAFDYFATQQVDIAIIEVGLGGRLDSTNLIHPLLSVITNISYDHQDLLGDTLEKIAFEKAGIIKPKTPVVVSKRQASIDTVFIEQAAKNEAPLFFASDYFQFEKKSDGWENSRDEKYKKIKTDLLGNYQQYNLAGVIFSVDKILKPIFPKLNDTAIYAGLENVRANTNLKGRFQVIQTSPLIVCDTGHNEAGIKSVIEQLLSMPHDKLWIVFGLVQDKAIDNILSLLPKNAFYFFCRANIPRALSAGVLHEKAKAFALQGCVVPDVMNALQAAKQKAQANDIIYVGGSTFVVAEVEGV